MPRSRVGFIDDATFHDVPSGRIVEFMTTDERQEQRRAQNRNSQRTLRDKRAFSIANGVSNRIHGPSLPSSDPQADASDLQEDPSCHFPPNRALSHPAWPKPFTLDDILSDSIFWVPPPEYSHWEHLDMRDHESTPAFRPPVPEGTRMYPMRLDFRSMESNPISNSPPDTSHTTSNIPLRPTSSSFTLPGATSRVNNVPVSTPDAVESTSWPSTGMAQQQTCARNPYPSQVLSTTDEKEPPADWQPPLHIAVEQGHEAIVKTLLDVGADIDECDSAGFTALHIAVRTKQEGMLQLLLESRADANTFDAVGWTPIRRAVQTGFEPGLKLLLNYGADSRLRAPRSSTSRLFFDTK